MQRFHKLIFLACILACAALIAGAAVEGSWSTRVPEKERSRANPYENDSQAVMVGQKLFQQHCASCHGSTAEGKGKRPNLHSDAIRNAKPGELQWLLTNGNLGKGMPSWSRLPEQQRWQLVTYLKTLQ
jgi:mono/diheme cytochrome c family protein